MQTLPSKAAQLDQLNSKQRQTWKAIFTVPTRSNITWAEMESLFLALGASVKPAKRGSKVRVVLNSELSHFHKPHPEKEVPKGAVEAARNFLDNAGVFPTSEL